MEDASPGGSEAMSFLRSQVYPGSEESKVADGKNPYESALTHSRKVVSRFGLRKQSTIPTIQTGVAEMQQVACSFRFLAGQLAANHRFASSARPLADLPWQEIVALANWQQVTPALWCGLRARGLEGELPGEAYEFLDFLYTQNRKRNDHLRRQIIEGSWALNKVGIEPLLLKGSAFLLLDLFGDAGARILTDIDLLVPTEDLDVAWQTLLTIGYADNPEETEEFTNHHHLPPLYRDGDHASLEIHRRPLHDRGDAFLGAKELWRNSVPLEISGARLRVPDPTSLVLHNILHAQLVNQFQQKGVICLRHLHDLAHLQHRFGGQIDWAKIDGIFRRQRRRPVLNNYLYLARRLVHAPGPDFGLGLSPLSHYWRCLARLHWTSAARFDNALQNFRSTKILHRYQLPDTAMDRATGRLRYAGHLLRRMLGCPPEIPEQSLPGENS